VAHADATPQPQSPDPDTLCARGPPPQSPDLDAPCACGPSPRNRSHSSRLVRARQRRRNSRAAPVLGSSHKAPHPLTARQSPAPHLASARSHPCAARHRLSLCQRQRRIGSALAASASAIMLSC